MRVAPIRFLVFLVMLLAFAGTPTVKGFHPNITAPDPNLTLGAVVLVSGGTCDTITVSIETASGGATVSGSSGVFSVSFGNVNGLGIGTPASGVTVSKSASGATYTTPIVVRVTFTNCSGGLNIKTVKVYQDATTSSASQSAAREGAAAGSVVSVPSSQGSATTVTSSPVSGAAITRYVGLFVSNANGASRVTGSLAPKLIYQFTATQ